MKNFEQFILDLSSLIGINTEKANPAPDAPFGENLKLALNKFLDIAKGMGFETKNYENYIGEVTFGKGEEIGVIGHLDVVPAGEGWDSPPYTLTKRDGVYYARGIADDKAPMLLNLYALKELKDSGLAVNKKFRLFVGCNEETGWQDVEYFSKRYSFPEYGYSPDGDFPVTYSEKGVVVVKFTLSKLKNFSLLPSGTVVNAVCAKARAKASADGINLELLKKHNLTLDGDIIESVGKAAHGSLPHLGVNAMKALFEYFLDMGEQVQRPVDYLFNDKAGIFNHQNDQGKLTLSPGLISQNERGIEITCDMRVPAPMTIAEAVGYLKEFDIPFTYSEKHPPMMVEKDGWFVNALISAYRSAYDETATPQAMGGSTFARAFNKGCSFGIEFPKTDNGIHQANEHISEKDLLAAYEIYKTAIFNLAK